MEFSHPDYTVIKTLGQGASGLVYLAVQNRLNRKVAVKVVIDTSPHTGGQRFLREAHILAQLDHPHIVSVYELAELQDQPGYLLAMAYVDGGTLRDRADNFTLHQALTTVRQIAQALGYAHANGFIHRDVKPENILFQGEQAMLADFGIARLKDSQTQMTQHGSVLGTPVYMSPEQVNGASVDARSDLYSLTIVLYELLAGSPPFKADTAIATGIQHLTHDTPMLPAVFSCYQPFIERVLAKDQNARPADAAAFIRELDQATEHFPWPQHEPLRWLRDQRVATHLPDNQHRKQTTGTVLRAIAVLGVVTGVAWLVLFRNETSPPTVSTPADVPTPTTLADSAMVNGSAVNESTANEFPIDQSVDSTTVDSLARIPVVEKAPVPPTPDTTIADELEDLLSAALQQQQAGNWFTTMPGAVSLYLDVLAVDEQHPTALDAIQQMTNQTRRQVEQALTDKQFDQVAGTMTSLQKHWPDYPGLSALIDLYETAVEQQRVQQQRLAKQRAEQQQRERRFESFMSNAAAAEAANRLWHPADDNAVFYYRAALAEDPANTLASAAVTRLAQSLRQQISANITEQRLNEAEALLTIFTTTFPQDSTAASLSASLNTLRDTLADRARQQALAEQQRSAITAVSQDVSTWLVQPDEAALSSYPQLEQRIMSLLGQLPEDKTLLQLQQQTRGRLVQINKASEDATDDDVFRLPGF